MENQNASTAKSKPYWSVGGKEGWSYRMLVASIEQAMDINPNLGKGYPRVYERGTALQNRPGEVNSVESAKTLCLLQMVN